MSPLAVVATVPAGKSPVAVAVNPTTNRVYVANAGSNDVTVIDGATNAVLATVPVGDDPLRLAVNPATNKVYVANWNGNSVTVIDGATNTVKATIPVVGSPTDVAINSNTNRVYVAAGKVAVIDGATDVVVANLLTGSAPYTVGVNPTTNRVYVANAAFSKTVSVIDGSTNAILTTISVGNDPDAVEVNAGSNQIYVANWGTGTVTSIDGATNAKNTLVVGSHPRDLALNPTTNKLYVANAPAGNVTVIDLATNAVTATLPGFWMPSLTASPADHVVVDAGNNRVYFTGYNTVRVFDSTNDSLLATLSVGGGPFALAVNPATHKVYVANRYSNNVSVICGQPRKAGDVIGIDLPVPMRPDLAVTKKLMGTAVFGQQVKYLVSVTNVGTAAMPGPINVTDILGAGLTYVAATGGGWTCSASGQTVTCTHPGPVPAGGSLPPITVTAHSDGTTEGVTNCAVVRGPAVRVEPIKAAKEAGSVPLDQNPANDRSCVDTPLQPPAPKPDLAIAKKPEKPLVAGQQATYQIAVANIGNASANEPIVVTDTLGPGLTYVAATGSGWTCSASGQTVTCTHPGPVPAGGSLPPITLTVQVAPDAKEVKNCATVKMVEQPPTPEVPHWVYIADANPANDQACAVSPVEPGDGVGMICGVKFLDHDGDGQQDPGEPGLPNWTIQVKDAAGNVIGTAVTDAKGRFCLEVKPGSYTVAEVVKPGWVQTVPQPVPQGTASVTVAAGQTVVVKFGNRPKQKP